MPTSDFRMTRELPGSKQGSPLHFYLIECIFVHPLLELNGYESIPITHRWRLTHALLQAHM